MHKGTKLQGSTTCLKYNRHIMNAHGKCWIISLYLLTYLFIYLFMNCTVGFKSNDEEYSRHLSLLLVILTPIFCVSQ